MLGLQEQNIQVKLMHIVQSRMRRGRMRRIGGEVGMRRRGWREDKAKEEIGGNHPRGPVAHDFADSAVHGHLLPSGTDLRLSR